jgi:hypothetical protein
MPGGLLPFDLGGPFSAFSGAGGTTALKSAASQAVIAPGFKWNYLTTTLPTGVAASALKALYQFDASADGLKDRSTNGEDLSAAGGAVATWPIMTGSVGCNGVLLYPGSWLWSAAGATLGTLGAATVEMTFRPVFNNEPSNSISCYFCIGEDSEAEASNAVFSVVGSDTYNSLGYFYETGGGGNRTAYTDWCCGALGHTQMLTMTRAADGITYDFYMDGVFLETLTAAGAPTGGTSVRAIVGSGGVAANDAPGIFHSVRYTHAYYTAAQALEAYQRVRGWID